jgi:hypothetical protein
MNTAGCGCGGLNFIVFTNSGNVRQESNTGSWAANQWYFVAGTYASSTGAEHVYVNGVLDDALAGILGTFRGTTYSTHFMIGGDNIVGDINEPFNGTIDDPRVYNRVLSATEVNQLYKLGNATIGN